MMRSLLLIAVALHPWNVSAFTFRPPVVSMVSSSSKRLLVLSMLDDDDMSISEPFFEMHQIPTATSGTNLDRVVECAEHGESCDVTEMTRMIEELEQLNMECEGELSRECSLDAVAARNVLKVALASKVDVEKAMEECLVDNPFAEMYEMNDECVSTNMSHKIPTAISKDDANLGRIIECAENGESCDLTEITDMIEELERLNMECEGTLSRECNLDAVEARNILKVALASQVAVEGAVRRNGA